MVKQLNEEELNKVAGGSGVSYGDIAAYVGRRMYFVTSPGLKSRNCGWVIVLAFDDPYIYAEPCDEETYNNMKKAYEDGCALEPTVFNSNPKCFKIDYGTWHATYLYTDDRSRYL